MTATIAQAKVEISDVVSRFRSRGWTPRDTSEGIHESNIVRLVNLSLGRKLDKDGLDYIPEIILTDFHAGKRVFRATASLYHPGSDQSFVVDCDSAQPITFDRRADNTQIDAVRDAMTDYFAEIYSVRREMKETVVSLHDRAKMADKAIRLRVPDNAPRRAHGKDLLVDCPHSDLFSVFVHMRARLLAGDYLLWKADIDSRKARPVSAFDEQIRISGGLWRLACEML